MSDNPIWMPQCIMSHPYRKGGDGPCGVAGCPLHDLTNAVSPVPPRDLPEPLSDVAVQRVNAFFERYNRRAGEEQANV